MVSSGARNSLSVSESEGEDMRAIMDAMAGAVAIRKPAEVKKMEKAPILSIRRKRARRRGGEGEAGSTVSLRLQ